MNIKRFKYNIALIGNILSFVDWINGGSKQKYDLAKRIVRKKAGYSLQSLSNEWKKGGERGNFCVNKMKGWGNEQTC